MRHSAARDENEPAIVKALKKIGASVTRLDDSGVPDLLVGYQGETILMEVKAPLGPKGGSFRGSLTPAQKEWWRDWKGGIPHIVRNEAEALYLLGIESVV